MATKKSSAKKENTKKSDAKKSDAPKKGKAKSPAKKKAPPLSIEKSGPENKSTAATSKTSASQNCKCLKRKTKFYCYHLIQGRWQKFSSTGYPTKEMCEENCCG